METDDGPQPHRASGRRGALSRAAVLLGAAFFAGTATVARAKDYASRKEALDELDRLASICGMRLGAVGRERKDAALLATRFLETLRKHQAAREEVRARFGLARGLDPALQLGEVDAELTGLRQALDDLMIAYAESLPVFADAYVVSRLAVDMVEVSKLRTIVDLWVVSEAA